MKNIGRNIRWSLVGAIVGGFIILLISIAVAIFLVTYKDWRQPEIILPTIVVFGVCVLLLLLFLMTSAFNAMQLDDKAQALGLPEGSIRALLALLLILIWVIVSIFLVGFTANPDISKNTDVMRFAQNFYTTMATLVVAIVAFYFGTKSVAAARAVVAETLSRPTITSVTPGKGNQGQSANLTIKGSNFRSPSSVRLSRETDSTTEEIVATNILSNPTQIICTIDIKSGQTPGEWDLIVENSDGGEGRRANAFTISP